MRYWLWWLVVFVLVGWIWVGLVTLEPKEAQSRDEETPPVVVDIPPVPPLPPQIQSQPTPPSVTNTEPLPTPIPPGERRPTALGDPRPPDTLWEAYPNLDALLKDAQAQHFSFAITIDGHMVYAGFGPPDDFVTQPNGTLLSKNYRSVK